MSFNTLYFVGVNMAMVYLGTQVAMCAHIERTKDNNGQNTQDIIKDREDGMISDMKTR